MKVEVTEFEKVYSFELQPITQLCGQNVIKKTYILESLRRYFSTYKYQEGQDKWQDNVKINNSVVGRKYFKILSIKGIDDIVNTIKCSKQSLMNEYLKQLIQQFEFQQHMNNINNELDEIFGILNNDINSIGNVELDYSIADTWDMVQKSDISGIDQTRIDNMSNYELIDIMMNLIEKVMGYVPRKEIIIFENIDHLLRADEYALIIERAKNIVKTFDIYFIFSTSIDGYVESDSDILEGVVVFGETDFQMPELTDIIRFVHDNYPSNKKISEEKLKSILKRIIHRIGRMDYLCTIEENVVCKIINQSLMMYDCFKCEETLLERTFLMS